MNVIVRDGLGNEYEISSDELRLISQNSKIAAIKSLRERYKLGLRESKNLVDTISGWERYDCLSCHGSGRVECPTCIGVGMRPLSNPQVH